MAEAIVAAQDAGLIESSIDPPPILDILITSRVTDLRTLKNTTAKKPYAVSPEVFGAWFTGYGTLEGFDYVHDVRIVNPSAGLKQWYDQRAAILRNAIAEVRKTKPARRQAGRDQAGRDQAGRDQAGRDQEGRGRRRPAAKPKAEEPKKVEGPSDGEVSRARLPGRPTKHRGGHPDRTGRSLSPSRAGSDRSVAVPL